MKPQQKIREFEVKIQNALHNELILLEKRKNTLIEMLNRINLLHFDNKNTYDATPENLRNKIFFTYNNHYYKNSGTNMYVGLLIHPHAEIEDRGYIKGCVTDLEGYLVLRMAANIDKEGNLHAFIYMPEFINSKHKDKYVDECNEIIKKANDKLKAHVHKMKDEINQYLKARTNMSLLYYVRNI
jgi:hypothetical protein